MGGDGGVVATNRRYMRGAGTADHTGDSTRYSASEKAQAERDGTLERLKTCALTGQVFQLNDSELGGGGGGGGGEIVTCPYGRLYNKVAALDALLNRMQNGNSPINGKDEPRGGTLGRYIRGMKDLHPVHFSTIQKEVDGDTVLVPVCPITGVELTGLQPAYVIVKTKVPTNKKEDQEAKDENNDEEEEEEEVIPNVLSEKALQQMGIKALQDDYGPFEKENLIRLVPPSSILGDIQTKWQERIQVEKAAKKKKKKRKKSSSTNGAKGELVVVKPTKEKKKRRTDTTKSATLGKAKSIQEVRTHVAAAVASNTVLSDLFSNPTTAKTEAERKDNLFVR